MEKAIKILGISVIVVTNASGFIFTIPAFFFGGILAVGHTLTLPKIFDQGTYTFFAMRDPFSSGAPNLWLLIAGYNLVVVGFFMLLTTEITLGHLRQIYNSSLEEKIRRRLIFRYIITIVGLLSLSLLGTLYFTNHVFSSAAVDVVLLWPWATLLAYIISFWLILIYKTNLNA